MKHRPGDQALASVNRRIEAKRRRRRIRQKLARFVARLEVSKGGGNEGNRCQDAENHRSPITNGSPVR